MNPWMNAVTVDSLHCVKNELRGVLWSVNNVESVQKNQGSQLLIVIVILINK